MSSKYILKYAIICLIFSFLYIGNAAENTDSYTDSFNSLDWSKWTAISSSISNWQIINGTASSTGDDESLIFEKYADVQYIYDIDFTGDDTLIEDHIVLRFYIYYEDSDNYGLIEVRDDDRGSDYYDSIHLEQKNSTFTNTSTYINTSTNTSIELNPKTMEHLKIVRLNKNIYIYHNGHLALTSEFKDENPSGNVGFYVYHSTGYFDNFYLRPIDMKNASGYINELELTSTEPSIRISSVYTLRLEKVSEDTALFSLNKFGKTVDTTLASEGDTPTLAFENGEEAVTFKVTELLSGKSRDYAKLEEIISADSGDQNPKAGDISVLPGYYQGEDMEINFSILNPGGIRYTGIPEITISNGEDRKTITPELDLAANESQRFTVMLKAPQKPGNHKLLVSFKIDEYSTVDNSVDYQVRALNPAVTTISSDLEENNGIYGTATIGSPFSAEFVDWNTTATVKVYWIAENGKKEVCSKNIPVTRETFNIALPYSDFYRGDGQYLVTIDTGGVQDTIYFDITGSDFVYTPAGEELPATIVSNELYLQLMVLLIGSFGALTVRNHLHPGRPSIPLNILAIVCGIAVLATAVLIANPGMVVVGVIILGLGVGISVVDKSDPLGAMFIESSHLHDFVGIILVFLSVAYIAIHVPQWSFGIIIGTLIAYYVGLNFHREE